MKMVKKSNSTAWSMPQITWLTRGGNFQQAYSSAYGGKPIIHWIFYKDAENMDKAREGIMTKTEYQKLKK